MNIKRLLISIMLVTFLFGCGKFNAFKELNVKEENVPKYKVSGEINNSQKADGKEIKQKFTNIDATGKSEEQIKKIAADYIQKNPDIDLILLNIKSERKEGYLVKYYSNEQAAKLIAEKKKADRYPVIFFEKQK